MIRQTDHEVCKKKQLKFMTKKCSKMRYITRAKKMDISDKQRTKKKMIQALTTNDNNKIKT
jgi:hypothetical protein